MKTFPRTALGLCLLTLGHSWAARQVTIPMGMFEGRNYNASSESATYFCNFVNITDQTQTLTIEYFNGTSSVDSVARTHTKVTYGTVTLLANQNITISWNKNYANVATSVPVSVAATAPSVVKVSISEPKGATAGNCYATYSPSGTSVAIPVNGGRPF